MSQHDFEIANQGFPSFRSDLNSALQALASNSAGTSEPSTTFAYQFWYDSTANLLKFRNADNDAWITLAFFDQTNDEWEVRTAVIQAIDGAGVVIKTDDGVTRVTVADNGTVTIANTLVASSGVSTDTISEATSGTGVTIDGVLLKDNDIEATDGTFSGGVYLGGTVAANYLDNYEEGTWTPTVSRGTVTTDGTDCTYTKIGRLVHITVVLSGFSDTSTAQVIDISSLPFNCSTNYGTGIVYGERINKELAVAVVRSDSTIRLRNGIGSTNFADVLYSDINDGTDVAIRFSVTYLTAS